jgi:hypothetical protein
LRSFEKPGSSEKPRSCEKPEKLEKLRSNQRTSEKHKSYLSNALFKNIQAPSIDFTNKLVDYSCIAL